MPGHVVRAAHLRCVLTASIAAWFAFAHADQSLQSHLLVRLTFVAGFQHHHGKRLFSKIKVGDPVRLVREPDNAHDVNAVRVEWQSQLIGYVPRSDNPSIARQLDFGNRLTGRVKRLSRSRDPDKRIELEIYVRL